MTKQIVFASTGADNLIGRFCPAKEKYLVSTWVVEGGKNGLWKYDYSQLNYFRDNRLN